MDRLSLGCCDLEHLCAILLRLGLGRRSSFRCAQGKFSDGIRRWQANLRDGV